MAVWPGATKAVQVVRQPRLVQRPFLRAAGARGSGAAAVMSLIQSARMNGHDPCAYLRDVMANLPKRRASQIGELLPNRWQPTGQRITRNTTGPSGKDGIAARLLTTFKPFASAIQYKDCPAPGRTWKTPAGPASTRGNRRVPRWSDHIILLEPPRLSTDFAVPGRPAKALAVPAPSVKRTASVMMAMTDQGTQQSGHGSNLVKTKDRPSWLSQTPDRVTEMQRGNTAK